MSSASLMQINEENYRHIRDGIPVKVKKQNGQIEEKKAIVIDFTNPENNDFLAIREMKIHGDLYRRRTDIVGFVNGIPLLFIELKKNSVDVQNAYTDNYTDYLDTIPHLFYYNAFLMLSNGTEAKVGTLGSKYEFFHEWKRLSEQEEGNVALETMLRGICKKDNFLDLLENFISFDHSDGETVKALEYSNGRKILDGKISETVRYILEQVVEEGSGRNAAVEGYRIGGKTATSQTLPRSANRYISSFLGFAPANDPKVLALCIIHDPQGIYYGGTIAAPVVRNIFENILPYLGVDKSDEKPYNQT